MADILDIKELIKIASEEDLHELTRNIFRINFELLEFATIIGFDTIEQLLLAEEGLVQLNKLEEELINKLIFLNKHIQPIDYEKGGCHQGQSLKKVTMKLKHLEFQTN